MPETKRPLKIFLCHAHSDAVVVHRLYTRLRREGVDVWLDKEKLLPGSDWELEIRKAVREADVVVVCLSQQFHQDGFRQKEVRLALDTAMEKTEGAIFIIPARLEKCDNLESLRKWHLVDLFEEDGYHRLIRALRIRAESIGASLRTRRGRQSQHRKESTDGLTTVADPLMPPENVAIDHTVEVPQGEHLMSSGELFPTSISQDLKPIHPNANGAGESEQRRLGKPERPTKIPGARFTTESKVVIVLIVLACIWITGFLGQPWIKKWFPATAVPPLVTAAATNTIESSLTPTGTSTLDPASLLTEIKDTHGVPMVLVPAGGFVMGTDAGQSDEAPAHSVYLDAYYIDKYEVTNLLYQACVDAKVCSLPRGINSNSRLSYYDNPKYGNFPVIYVDWSMARGYCAWRDAQLPTEAQWEKAARGTSGGLYPWGDTIDAHNANYESNRGDTTQVGIFPKGQSPYHVYDMAGNVSEWVVDWYSSTQYSSSGNNIKLASNPSGPSSGSFRVWRGGSWNSPPDGVYSFVRGFLDPTVSSAVVGFRCARAIN